LYHLAQVGGFLFLRWVNPALMTPEVYDLMPEGKVPSARSRRNLILMTKIVQNLSNGLTFGKKEQYMEAANEYITDNTARVERYLGSYDWYCCCCCCSPLIAD
jgi:Ras GTPase-activating-like protein IQGAP2/3